MIQYKIMYVSSKQCILIYQINFIDFLTITFLQYKM